MQFRQDAEIALVQTTDYE